MVEQGGRDGGREKSALRGAAVPRTRTNVGKLALVPNDELCLRRSGWSTVGGGWSGVRVLLAHGAVYDMC